MPSSSFSLPNIGTANLTAILATSSLYIYLIALHQHQQKTLLADQEREQERVRLSQLQSPSQKQKQKIQTQPPNSRGGYTDSQTSSGSRTRRYSGDQSQIGNRDQRQYYNSSTSNSHPNSNTYRPPPFKMSKTFSPSEVAAHKDAENGMYLIIDEHVYDVTNFLEEHPGGAKILKRVAGKDASKQFWKYHNEGVLKKYGEKLKIGAVGEKAKL
ncbi:uncharacterized protein EAF01_004060 [Botrytis porri]|uniref:Cytochrome b5 heme-binding domain-containing protein n=1 Tax=Botrytis porri TaxID=87229 RepID=A0A4Z1L1Q4_9HELO|nr:uncharacterized protein EAF01_004060 [Botrytis porri]KAF7908305.1 hypothetical protein EAF01_004060 [Botrytis porri]TGO90627.1 hypothetical protein BPOR_0057g00250 [Botrytis porri]